MMSAWNLHKAWPEAEFKVDDGEWELRAESVSLKEHADAQSKELLQRKQQVEELQEKERVAIENISTIHQELEKAKQAVIESEKKLKFKEETVVAAHGQREDAAET
ncbi:interaptin-like protein isoform X1 [Tanacetum coccineum]